MKDPAFLFYPNDWLGGTMGMSFEQKGAYIELLMTQFSRGHMTSHMIGQVLGQSSDKIWEAIQDKFIQDEKGLYYNERLEQEQVKRKAYTNSRKNNKTGKNQHTNSSNESGSNVGHMTLHMGNGNRNRNNSIVSNYNTINGQSFSETNESKKNNDVGFAEVVSILSFDEFWSLYDKKVGDKAKLKKKWESISEDDRRAIYDHVPLYIHAQPDKQYRKDPQTYLNNKSWNDEIIGRNELNKTNLKEKQRDIGEFAEMLHKHVNS